ncbi:hypothetical protein DO97_12885 [Neosynechococcus sphagnicola sy1]|uniref:ATP synthase subunit beta n=1 Tax=Neosynechococcus sphagnicola sy1 TaxID=1497020 RepID=A0A098TP93_9CYAN|nr:class I SAM-dependent methyltransferase [Neosynechococcus sphagnicola]KGF73707.1 hypothetical protein DO97_12885 [Neosynechococcus sphagnicola sy1]
MLKNNPHLIEIIRERILASPQQRLSFAEFMELALYEPAHGYYCNQVVTRGIQGDFFTAPHLGADFGELLAAQFVQMWEILDRPAPFTLLEMGAGQGLLATHILNELKGRSPDLWSVLQYWIVERSQALVAQQRQQLQLFPHIRWCTWEEIPRDSLVGCCFSNELVDAFPVHQVVITEGKLREIFVTLSQETDSCLREIIDEPSVPELVTYFDRVGIHWRDLPEGYRSEVNLAALSWLQTVAERLEKGYLLTIDYGYPAAQYYSPARTTGTLQCYYRHAHHGDPYQGIGYQDLTAHVNFTALERQGDASGLQMIGFTQQSLFLMALGLGARIAALGENSQAITPALLQAHLRHRQNLHSLIDPMGLGKFGVLVQGKGLSPSPQLLEGLRVPIC